MIWRAYFRSLFVELCWRYIQIYLRANATKKLDEVAEKAASEIGVASSIVTSKNKLWATCTYNATFKTPSKVNLPAYEMLPVSRLGIHRAGSAHIVQDESSVNLGNIPIDFDDTNDLP